MTHFKKHLSLALILLFLGSLMATSTVDAQTPFTIYCVNETNHITSNTPFSLLGTYYHLLDSPFASSPGTNYRFERLNQTENIQFSVPFSSELSSKLSSPSISPNGKFMVFRPRANDTGLTVWNIETNEVASFMLQPSDFSYLERDSRLSYEHDQDKLIWLDDNHLSLQYFYHDSEFYDWVVSQKIFTIQENPLSIIEGEKYDIPYPDLPVPAGNELPKTEFSPNHTYATRISFQGVYPHGLQARFQIYNLQNMEMMYDRIPVDGALPISKPFWMADEQTVFLLLKVGLNEPWRVLELKPSENFNENSSLQGSIEDNLGAGAGPLGLQPMLLPDETRIIFSVYSEVFEQAYFLLYNPTTHEKVAICDPNSALGGDRYYFWAAGGQYFGYWNNGNVYAYNLSDGTSYQLPSDRWFVGWSGPFEPDATATLRSVFNSPSCTASCWLGIEPGVTDLESAAGG